MKTYVLGSNGMLGKYLLNYFKGSIPVTRKELDANDVVYMGGALFDLGVRAGDVLINAMGITNKRAANANEFMAVNGLFPIMLAIHCESRGAHLIHISTDCVYSGDEGGYTEHSRSDANSIYGISKSVGDHARCTVIRTSIIGENTKSDADFLEWVRSNKGTFVTGYANHFWNGVTCLQLAKICGMIIDRALFWKGVRHIFSPEVVSKSEMVRMVNDVYDLGITIQEIYEPYCDRSLSTVYAECSLFDIPGVKEQIEEQRNFSLR